jgi:hypothetical protein
MTAILSSPGSAQPLVRIRRAPALEPPADDDRRADDHPICAGQLALFTSIHGVRARTGHADTASARDPGTASARQGTASAGYQGTASAGYQGTASAGYQGTASARRAQARQPTAPASLSASGHGSVTTAACPAGPATGAPGSGNPAASAPAQVAAGRFVAACVEVLNGFRPVGHLRALTTPFEFTGVTTQLTRRAVRVRMPGRDRAGQERVSMRRLRVFEQRTGVAEAVAVLRHGETSWAMALRFEHRRDSWLCTLLEVI